MTKALKQTTQIRDFYMTGMRRLFSGFQMDIVPLNPMFRAPYLPDAWSLESAQGLAQLNDEISRQAMTIAYVDDFLLLMLTAFAAAPMLLLLRGPKRAPAVPGAATERGRPPSPGRDR